MNEFVLNRLQEVRKQISQLMVITEGGAYATLSTAKLLIEGVEMDLSRPKITKKHFNQGRRWNDKKRNMQGGSSEVSE